MHQQTLSFLPLAALLVMADSADVSSSIKNNWYTKYPYYPKYCSTPEEMATRAIPPLPIASKAGDTRLLQVTAIIRHGARAPWNAASHNETCWPDYHPVWDCDLTTWVGAPPRTPNDNAGMFWMDKQFTALRDPQHNLSNVWRGTCQKGQLLLQGYDQELQNGQFLRDAYVYQGEGDFGHDERMRLVDTTSIFNSPEDLESTVYYRSDDEQRTIMSGQLVLRGMLQPELDQYSSSRGGQHPALALHTADRPRDILGANKYICPRLNEIQERFHKSQEYQAFLQSPERLLMEEFKQDVLQGGKGGIDCLMTTICTDRTLPDALNDYKGEDIGKEFDNYNTDDNVTVGDEQQKDYGQNLFARLAQATATNQSLLHRANDGEFSKVAMGPLWGEILHHIKAAYADTEGDPTPAKLALFSGHDSTLMPLLASLGAWNVSDFWPTYAAMMILEVHELNFDGTTDLAVYPTNYAFRLLYNGQVWTSRIKGCPAEEQLCDLDVLLHRITPMLNRNCTLQYPPPQAYADPVSQAQDILKTEGGQYAAGFVALASFVMGMLVTMLFVCCCSNRSVAVVKRQRHRELVLVATGEEEDDELALGEQSAEGEQDGIVMGATHRDLVAVSANGLDARQ